MRRRITTILMLFTLLTGACGGGTEDATPGDDGTSTTTGAPTTSAPSTTAATIDDGEPSDDEFDVTVVQQSVVKILAEGTFVDIHEGLQLNTAGVGSGFIISTNGLVITNNHVVTGAALLQVWLDGESDPINAQILGVSECSDLAVIDLEGDSYTPLAFATKPAAAGMGVFAAGYPVTGATDIANIDYTLTAGIISATDAPSQSSWSSVDGVLEHDARIRGGNSGGPLVSDQDGSVMGINFAGTDLYDQNFAISSEDANPIIETLSSGQDVDSIGLNGQAFFDDDIGLSGTWAAGVQTGSPAADAGIVAGDIITSLEGLALAIDRSMDDYCDIIRTQGADATMSIEVLRVSTDELLEGQLNGHPLVQSFSFAQEFEEQVAGNNAGAATDTYTDYVSITALPPDASASMPSNTGS